jgi:uncharacterized protein RhaS with RHS repeats
VGDPSTGYKYNLDKQLKQIRRPDGQVLTFDYDSATGLLSALTLPTGLLGYTYDTTTGKLRIVEAPDSTLSYTYSGALLDQTIWSGPTVAGSVSRSYDNDFRVTTLRVNNADPVTFTYGDADGLLTQAGALTLHRDAQNGLITGTMLGVVSDTRNYNRFGELEHYRAEISGTLALSIQFTLRDKRGRIKQKLETVGGVVHTYDYDYDLADRLERVKQDGVITASYTYDSNGNRRTGPGVLNPATYDDQDRLRSYAVSTYDYTDNGELKTKTTGALVTSYDYDVLGNLKHVSLPGGATIDYIIDGQNRRIGKKVGGTLVQGFLYQDDLKPIAELDGTNSLPYTFFLLNDDIELNNNRQVFVNNML